MNDYSNLFVCLMGMGTVFFGLICLIVLTTILGHVLGRKQQTPAAPAASAAPVSAAADGSLSPEVIAAISAAIAEDLGTDITGIRIKSIKKL